MEKVRKVAAVIRKNDMIFATARDYGEFKGGWEFPGGKIEEGETPQLALVREIKEGLDTDIEVGELIDTIEYDYPNFHLSMDCFWAKVVSGNLDLKEAPASKWLTREQLDSVEWLPADVTLIEKINKILLNNECEKYAEEELLQISGVDKVLRISKSEILKINKRSLKSDISKSCTGRNLWALFGFIDSVNMVCLQVASAGDIVTEITNDLCSMQPICEADTKSWGSGLHKKVFTVTYGLDTRCQKYRNMFESYEGFYVVSIDHLKFLGRTETSKFDKVKFAEVMFAAMTCSLYWKPFGEENKILKIVQEIDDGCVD
jgi:hypothetical protein